MFTFLKPYIGYIKVALLLAALGGCVYAGVQIGKGQMLSKVTQANEARRTCEVRAEKAELAASTVQDASNRDAGQENARVQRRAKTIDKQAQDRLDAFIAGASARGAASAPVLSPDALDTLNDLILINRND